MYNQFHRKETQLTIMIQCFHIENERIEHHNLCRSTSATRSSNNDSWGKNKVIQKENARDLSFSWNEE